MIKFYNNGKPTPRPDGTASEAGKKEEISMKKILSVLAAAALCFGITAAAEGTTGQTENSVAQIIGSDQTSMGYYENLQTAFDEVAGGQTVKLLKDVTLADDTGVEVLGKGTEGSEVTFDLNGYTLSGSNSGNYASATSTYTKSGILRVYGSYVILTDLSEGTAKGKIINTTTGTNGSVCTVLLNQNTTDTTATSETYSAGDKTQLTVNNGVGIELSSESDAAQAIYAAYVKTSYGSVSVNINDSAITSTGYVLELGYTTNITSVVINGGTFKSTGYAYCKNAIDGSSTKNTTINGGVFYNFSRTCMGYLDATKYVIVSKTESNEIITTVTDTVPETGYALFPAGEYSNIYTSADVADGDVTAMGFKAAVIHDGSYTYYSAFSDACAAAASGDTVKLLDKPSAAAITVDKKITIDLNGYSISSSVSSKGFTVSSTGSLTVIDSSESGEGKVSIKSKASLTVEDGGSIVIAPKNLDSATVKVIKSSNITISKSDSGETTLNLGAQPEESAAYKAVKTSDKLNIYYSTAYVLEWNE